MPAPDMPLYASEDEIARAVLGANAKKWPAVAALDEKKGLPPIDLVRGGRYWPDVERFYANLNRHKTEAPGRPQVVTRLVPDGEEHPHAETEAAIRRERRAHGDRRARA